MEVEWKWKLNGNGRKLDGNGRKFDGNGWPQTAIIYNGMGESTEQTVSVTCNSFALRGSVQGNMGATWCADIGSNKLHTQLLTCLSLPVYRHRGVSLLTCNSMALHIFLGRDTQADF